MFNEATKISCLCFLAIFIANVNAGKIQVEDYYSKGQKAVTSGNRIVNGQNITISNLPYIVQIHEPSDYVRKFVCGGTVISERHILTAAHCMVGYNSIDLQVVANVTHIGEAGIRRNVKAIHMHPAYDHGNFNNDVAVLTLEEPLPLGKGVNVAEMCSKPWDSQHKITVAGWGKTSADADAHSNHLQMAVLNGISVEDCREQFEDSSRITSQMLCTRVAEGKDGCQGDSGGPAFVRGRLCGIVSFGYSCGVNGYPSIFTNVPMVRSFIDESMKE